MIAFAKDDEVQLAAIYDPIHKELYFAKKGRGAFLNGKRIHCSETKEWERSFGSGTCNMRKRVPDVVQYLASTAQKETFWMSALGSIGITMTSIASGKRDWAFSLGGFIWDFAPVFLILKEAGCIVTNLDGKPWRFGTDGMIVGNKYLQPKLLKLVKRALAKSKK
jgi:myo-inositol-1(or 4)-monophosphatase